MSQKPLEKILVAEDEADIRSILQLALEDIGNYTVKFCVSGEEILKCADQFEPDLFLLDMMMPVMDGMTTLIELRKTVKFKETPIIFLTAKMQSNEIASYRQAGAIDVIAKPFDPMTLAETLKIIWEQYNG